MTITLDIGTGGVTVAVVLILAWLVTQWWRARYRRQG